MGEPPGVLAGVAVPLGVSGGESASSGWATCQEPRGAGCPLASGYTARVRTPVAGSVHTPVEKSDPPGLLAGVAGQDPQTAVRGVESVQRRLLTRHDERHVVQPCAHFGIVVGE